ncbi:MULTISPECIES: YegP family protein [Aquimarina]|uniref:YegP family protein n=1 Tax=Aquimarina TaxID=290174 RepID=UPI000CDE9B61|nr:MULTISPECIES: YegP family protein [Aquimarina]
MSNQKFKIHKSDKNNQYYFNLHAGNSQVILSSEMYTTKQGCKGGIESVKNNSQIDEQYDRKEAKNGQFYFTLKATNGEAIGKSEMYTTKTARDNGIESVKKNAPIAETLDTTIRVVS